MTKHKAPSGLILIGLLGNLVAQEQIPELEPTTVLAKKFEASSENTTSTVDVISAEELERKQQYRLLDALNGVPGAQGLSTAGLVGNTGSALIRGLGTDYTQVVIDGVRITDATNGLGNYLANAHLGGISQVAILRGPQSVLYGTGAAGGVIGFESNVGSDEPSYQLFLEGGSFDTYRATLSTQGAVGALQYGAEFGHYFTENDTYSSLPKHDYTQDQGTLALQWQADDFLVKLSYRGSDNLLKTTSVSSFGTFTSDIETQSHLLALNLENQITPDWISKLTLGYYDEDYDGDFDGSFGPSLYETNYERTTVNWNHRLWLRENLELLAGFESSLSDYENSDGQNTDYQTYGAYVNAAWKITHQILLEGGVRYDEHNEFGDDVAWNFGAAYRFNNEATRIRTRISEAYRTPSRLDSEAFVGGFINQIANDDLTSEEILGFEIAVEHNFGNHQFELGFFQQELEDAIGKAVITPGFPEETQRQNISGTTRVSGYELALKGSLCRENLRYRLSWTQQDKEELIDIPNELVDLELNYEGPCWLVGAGATYVSGANYGSTSSTDNRTVSRIYGQYEVNEHLKIHARIENLFNENYALSNFGGELEGPGRAVYAGATFEW